MDLCSYQFENLEDREMAFHNIVKWYGESIVERIENFELKVHAPLSVQPEAQKIVEKHSGKLKNVFQ